MSEEAIQVSESQEVAETPVAAPEVAAAPEPAPEAAAPTSWLDSLPEDLRNEPSLRHVPDTQTLAKNYVNAQRMIGADKVALPGKAATDDEWRAVYQKLGAPNDPSSYDIEKTEVFDDMSFDAFRDKAYEIGLSNKQASSIAGLYEQQINSAREAMLQKTEEARFQGEQELRKEFGQYFEDRLSMAQAAARTMLGSTEMFDDIQLADGRSLGDHPEVIKMFVKMAETLGEDGLVGEPTEVVMSAADAQQRYNEVVQQGTPYWDKFHPQHQAFIDEALHLRSYFGG